MAILGASGFIGGHVRRAFEARGLAVAAPHRAATGPGWLKALAGTAPSVVVNCAGALHGSASQLQASNVQLVADLLKALEGSSTRLVQIGSAAEYGAGTPGQLIGEDSPARPLSAYGASKLAATQLVVDAARAGQVAGVVLRIFNPIGVGISSDSLAGGAALLLREALAAQQPLRLGPLDATRDFFDVRDAADAVVAASHAAASGQIVNVGSGRGTTARELVQLLADLAGFAGSVEEGDTGSARSGEVSWLVADISRARMLLGWSPRRSLREALAQLWAAGSAPSPTTSSSSAPS